VPAGARVYDALSTAARLLSARGFPATADAVVGGFCLDVRLGPAVRDRGRGRHSHAMLQAVDPELPNLGVFLTYDREADGRPVDSHRQPVFDTRLDRRLTYDVMPVVNAALNPVDPAGLRRSLHVGVFHGRSTVGDLLLVPWTAARTFRSFRPQGQLAAIWADFDAPLAEAISRSVSRVAGRRDIHLLPRTPRPSAAWVPVPGDPQWKITCLSDAFDAGLALAREYVRRHLARYAAAG
jgi:hypothetical protein